VAKQRGLRYLLWLYIRGVALLAPEAQTSFVDRHAARQINRASRTADFYGINGASATSFSRKRIRTALIADVSPDGSAAPGCVCAATYSQETPEISRS